jgi:hypothetical protein
MQNPKTEAEPSIPFSGSRTLVALAIGCAIGAAVAYFLKVLIENTPAEIDVLRLRLFIGWSLFLVVLAVLRSSRCANSRSKQRIRSIAVQKPSARNAELFGWIDQNQVIRIK